MASSLWPVRLSCERIPWRCHYGAVFLPWNKHIRVGGRGSAVNIAPQRGFWEFVVVGSTHGAPMELWTEILIPLKNPLATFSVSVWPQERPTGVIGGRSGPITAIAPARPPPNPRLRPGAAAGSQKNEAVPPGSG